MAILITDTFTGSDGTAWNSTTWPIQRDTRDLSPASPTPDIQANRGRMYTAIADRRYIAVTDPVLANVDITVALTVNSHVFTEIGYRVGTNLDTGQPSNGYALHIEHKVGEPGEVLLYNINSYAVVAFMHDVPIEDFAPRWWRIRAKANRHQIKWWLVGDTEPPTWKIDILDATYTAGRVFLGFYNNYPPGDATTVDWDGFRLEELVPPPEGFRILGQNDLIDALYVGTEPVTAAWWGAEPLVIP